MVTVEEFSRLVAGIYDAAVAPQHWRFALRDIHQAMDGTFGTLLMADHAVWSVLDSTLPDAAVADYDSHYCHLDHVLSAVRQGPVGTIRTGTELVAPHRDTEFYRDWLRPNDVGDALLVRLAGGPNPHCIVIGSPLRREAFDTADRLTLMAGLIEHLQQALFMQSKLGAATNDGLMDAVDAARHGLMVIADGGLVINLNSAAERILDARDGLGTRSGRLVAMGAHVQQEFAAAINDAVCGRDGDVRRGRALACPRPSGKRPYVVQFLPSHHRDDEPGAVPVAVTLIIDPEDEPEPAAATLRRLYGLTETERKVALGVLHGAKPHDISEEMSISVTTVRTHLQHVFDKTGTHRQTELVRLLFSLSP